MKHWIVCCVIFLAAFSSAQAKTITCYPDSWPNIPQAFALADSGDTILATPGIYIADHETLRVKWPDSVDAIVLMSEFGPESTVIDGMNEWGDAIIHFLRSDSLAVIEGFTIRNGYAPGSGGSAISGGLATIRGNVIINNRLTTGGAISGGGVIEWNFIAYNSADLRGGGIYGNSMGRTYRNNTIAYNTSPDGGGACFTGGAGVLAYNNIFGNSVFGIKNLTSGPVFIDAENNWWGDPSGPYNPWTNPDGKGDIVSEYVDYEPWLTGPGVMETKVEPRTDPEDVSHLYIYPNPCRGSAKIRYSVPTPGHVSVSVYDVTGRLVETLVDEWKEPGIYSTRWDGSSLASGSYFCQLDAESHTGTMRFTAIRR